MSRGSPGVPHPDARRPLAERFWEKVEQDCPEDCWMWVGARDSSGYGHLREERVEGTRQMLAHRISWELRWGRPVPDGMNVCHRCDVRACVNPRHLFVGSQRDNIIDGVRKGRIATWSEKGY